MWRQQRHVDTKWRATPELQRCTTRSTRAGRNIGQYFALWRGLYVFSDDRNVATKYLHAPPDRPYHWQKDHSVPWYPHGQGTRCTAYNPTHPANSKASPHHVSPAGPCWVCAQGAAQFDPSSPVPGNNNQSSQGRAYRTRKCTPRGETKLGP